MNPVAIEMKSIDKSFGLVKANQNIDMSVNRGEIHALLGENGSGKSTLMNMLSGIYRPDKGEIKINGKVVEIPSPSYSMKLGIGMIHQHFKLVESMTARENIMMGHVNPFFYNRTKFDEEILEISEKYGLHVDLDKKTYNMSVGEKQTLEIIKVLLKGADILILDEPTAVLTPQEISRLFEIMRNMKNKGCAIIIITHKLNEVIEISDRVTVLRKGRSFGTVDTSDVGIHELIEMMVGKRLDLSIRKEKFKGESVGILKAENLSVTNKENKEALSDISFELKKGEILGVAGVMGSGQKELCEALAGLIKDSQGRIFFEGEDITKLNPREVINKGIRLGFIPEDRLGMGLIGSMDIVDNVLLKDYHNQKGFLLRRKSFSERAKQIVEKLDVNTPGINYPIKKLSGGNIQKVLLGREIESEPKVLITAYPVRGLDIGASYKIYDLLGEQKKRGTGILFVGEDLDVLMAICDRIMILYNGELTGIVNPDEITKEDIGYMMAGGEKEKLYENKEA